MRAASEAMDAEQDGPAILERTGVKRRRKVERDGPAIGHADKHALVFDIVNLREVCKRREYGHYVAREQQGRGRVEAKERWGLLFQDGKQIRLGITIELFDQQSERFRRRHARSGKSAHGCGSMKELDGGREPEGRQHAMGQDRQLGHPQMVAMTKKEQEQDEAERSLAMSAPCVRQLGV